MQPGDLVFYTADPLLFGKLLILEVTEHNQLRCEAVHADSDGTFARGDFSAHELELHAKAKAAA